MRVSWFDVAIGFLMALIVAFALTLGWVVMGCGPLAPVPDDLPGQCAAACENMRRLDVPGWEGSPGEDEQLGTGDDVACWRVCVDTEAGGYPFNARCLSVAITREGAEACYE